MSKPHFALGLGARSASRLGLLLGLGAFAAAGASGATTAMDSVTWTRN